MANPELEFEVVVRIPLSEKVDLCVSKMTMTKGKQVDEKIFINKQNSEDAEREFKSKGLTLVWEKGEAQALVKAVEQLIEEEFS